MLNPFGEVDWNPDVQNRKKFAVSLIIGFPILAAIFLAIAYLTTQTLSHFALWLGVFGLTLGVLFWLLPQISKPFYLAWYFLACCMGFVIGNALFALLFYLVFTPLGLCLRLRRQPTITKSFDKSQTSYWRDAEKSVDVSRYYRQF